MTQSCHFAKGTLDSFEFSLAKELGAGSVYRLRQIMPCSEYPQWAGYFAYQKGLRDQNGNKEALLKKIKRKIRGK